MNHNVLESINNMASDLSTISIYVIAIISMFSVLSLIMINLGIPKVWLLIIWMSLLSGGVAFLFYPLIMKLCPPEWSEKPGGRAKKVEWDKFKYLIICLLIVLLSFWLAKDGKDVLFSFFKL